MDEKAFLVPDKNKIQSLYDSYSKVFSEVLENMEAKLKSTIKLASMPTYKARIKSFKSYYKKILRQKPDESKQSSSLVTLTDMIGIRVICAFIEDLREVERQVSAHFTVKEIERKGAEQSFREFGYESIHILVKIPPECMPKKNTSPALPEDIVCEIQIRTILQDAWAEVEHELIYKSEFNPFDKPLRRKLASINASLSLADMIFQEIRDYQNKLQTELGTRRGTFYEKADELTEQKELCETKEVQQEAASDDFIDPNASIDDLVLQALHEHNLGNLSRAEVIYTKILESQPEPPAIVMSVIFKHRGMAYFAQSKFDEALSDFKDSIARDPKGFRAMYYEGIVYSIQNKNKEAIESFNRSLEIDSYQSHVYYRRALSYYNLGEYEKAMQDVEKASKLGLDDADLTNLKNKLVQKFDMGV
ncbi:MAG: tetratricopeptide repeat protein [Treponema sp.]|nr:tetratricopeptide repeat protein [Treponema sp.]